MKKLGLLLVTAFAAFSFSACNETDGDYPSYMNFVTVRTITDSKDFYFETDNGTTIYPSDKTLIGVYEATDGKRAAITFNFLTDIEGYDYNIKLYAIGNMFTTKARAIDTQEKLDALKDNPIMLTGARLSKTYLTLSAIYPVHDNSKHTFDLIINDVKKVTTNEGYLDVELRHNADGELNGATGGYYMSFSLEDIKDRLSGMKGITIRVKGSTLIDHHKIDFLKE